ncbi:MULTISPECIES: hypothetical protein [Brevibacillus]|uniref:hypothetical protein n=1 Tax=Brevibacillus TaxID=55080 RepID=UPI003625FBB4
MLPALIYEKCFVEVDVRPLSVEMTKYDEYFYDLENPKMRSYINKRLVQHNEQLKLIPRNEIVAVTLIAALPTMALVIEECHVNFKDWNRLVNTVVEDIIDSLEEDPQYLMLKEEYKSIKDNEETQRQQASNILLNEWSEYLLACDEFKLCSNQRLRTSFFHNNWMRFVEDFEKRNSIKDRSFRIYVQHEMLTKMDMIWNRIKAEKYK